MNSLLGKNVTGKSARVDHPLAKYNSKGDLYCLLCNNLVKNPNAWKVHLSTKSHKDQLLLFKAGKTTGNNLKRPLTKADDAPPRSLKKPKTQTVHSDNKSNQDVIKNQSPEKPPKKTGILKKSSIVVPQLPEGFVPKSRQASLDQKADARSVKIAEETKSSLPAGFFDDGVLPEVVANSSEPMDSTETDAEEEEGKEKKPIQADLPEGFFDDAREDARARKIEYKDPQQIEWERFQDEMEKEDDRYNAILEDDDQKLREERDFDIGIEQKLWTYRVESIATSAETGEICIADKEAFEVKLQVSEKMEKFEVKEENEDADIKMDESSSDEEEDFMDWRTKKVV